MTEEPKNLKPIIAELALGKTLDVEQARIAFDIMMSGDATPAQMGGLLMALRVRGETISEITGAARAMRDLCARLMADGTSAGVEDQLMDFDSFNELIGVEERLELVRRLQQG